MRKVAGVRYLLWLLPLVAVVVAPERVWFALANLSLFSEVQISRGVSYGPGTRHKLDVYQPAPGQAVRGAIVFFYGGRWTYGAREDYRFVGERFASKGFVTFIPDYPKYPTVKFPVFVEDGARALAWVHDHAGSFGGNPRRVFVAGHSAGAHIGALLTTDAHYLQAFNTSPTETIAGFAGLAGPYEFTPDEPDLEDMFGPPSRYTLIHVTSFVTKDQPPMLLLWGDADTTVWRANIDKLKQAIESVGGRVHTIVYPGVTHLTILSALSWLTPTKTLVADDIASFFEEAAANR